jgi:hypothetical protein
VQASPWYFDSARRARRLLLVSSFAMAALLLCGGCVTVKPEAKELLADPAMLFDSAAMARRHEEHALENREGSMGGGSARGSGCGCN